MAPRCGAEFFFTRTSYCRSASVTDTACPEDQATARGFNALAHDAAIPAAVRIIAVGVVVTAPAVARTDARCERADLNANAARTRAGVELCRCPASLPQAQPSRLLRREEFS